MDLKVIKTTFFQTSFIYNLSEAALKAKELSLLSVMTSQRAHFQK